MICANSLASGRWIIYLVVALSLLLSYAGCKDDDDSFGLEGQQEQCVGPQGSGCVGESNCESGQCACLDKTTQLAPGFCLQSRYPNTFVTYDTILGCVDTTLVAFLDDPFDVKWAEDEPYRTVSSYVYNRNPNVNTPGSTGAVTLLRPESGTGVDTVYISTLIGEQDIYCSRGSWFCMNAFAGAFVGRDTIRGIFQAVGCNDGGSGDPFPEDFLVKIPMTFVRLN